jgi:hypothetical protein
MRILYVFMSVVCYQMAYRLVEIYMFNNIKGKLGFIKYLRKYFKVTS